MRILTGLFTVIGILMVLLSLGSLGHDIYYAYEKKQAISLSQIGYYFQTYIPDYYEAIKDSLGDNDYITLSKYFYDAYTAYFTGVLAFVFLGFAFIFGRLCGEESSTVSYKDSKASPFARGSRSEGKKIVYKRK